MESEIKHKIKINIFYLTMLSSRNKNSSPAKENFSPDGSYLSPRKQVPTIKQLIHLLK